MDTCTNDTCTDNSAISDELKAAVEAVDALNSWVRSASFSHSLRNPRHAIYWLKRCAIEAAHNAGLARHKRVGVIATCRDCGGAGRYVDSYGDEKSHCWKCANSGQLILYFVETGLSTLAELWAWPVWTWHTPENLWPREWQVWLPNEFPRATSWKTEAEGLDLSPAAAAGHLNTAELFFTARPPLRRIDFDYQSEMRDDFDYRLYVGQLGRHCVFCGEDSKKTGRGYHSCRGNVEWNAHVCTDCESRYAQGVRRAGEPSIWEEIPWPAALLRDEAIRLWLERHPAKEKVIT